MLLVNPCRYALRNCLATKRRRRSLPKSVDNKPELALLKTWEVAHFGVSDPLRVPSSRGNRYYSLFDCGKRGMKLLVAHRKTTGAQQAYVKFITRIGSHPKTLFTDFGGEMCSDEFDHFLLAHDSGILWLSTVLLHAVTSPAIDESTKTIFEATYGQPPDYDALPPV